MSPTLVPSCILHAVGADFHLLRAMQATDEAVLGKQHVMTFPSAGLRKVTRQRLYYKMKIRVTFFQEK